MAKDFMEFDGKKYELPDLEQFADRRYGDGKGTKVTQSTEDEKVEPEAPEPTTDEIAELPGIEVETHDAEQQAPPTVDIQDITRLEVPGMDGVPPGGDLPGGRVVASNGDNGSGGAGGPDDDLQDQRMIAMLSQLQQMNGTLVEILRALEG